VLHYALMLLYVHDIEVNDTNKNIDHVSVWKLKRKYYAN
jgi:hypothetical protein